MWNNYRVTLTYKLGILLQLEETGKSRVVRWLCNDAINRHQNSRIFESRKRLHFHEHDEIGYFYHR